MPPYPAAFFITYCFRFRISDLQHRSLFCKQTGKMSDIRRIRLF
jgi:hypothetical protein